MPPTPKTLGPCKAEACAIQECLSSNDYQEAKCLPAINALIQCCEQFQEDEAPVHCAFSEVYTKLARRLQQQAENQERAKEQGGAEAR